MTSLSNLDDPAAARDAAAEFKSVYDRIREQVGRLIVGQDEIVERIAEVFPLEQMPARGAAPADRWRYLDGAGTVGVIPSVTKPFCGDCDRVRLTAEGQFRTCLFATDEFDLRAIMRSGGDDDALAERIVAAVGTKWAGHQINRVEFTRPNRSMSQIGG